MLQSDQTAPPTTHSPPVCACHLARAQVHQMHTDLKVAGAELARRRKRTWAALSWRERHELCKEVEAREEDKALTRKEKMARRRSIHFDGALGELGEERGDREGPGRMSYRGTPSWTISYRPAA